MRRSRPVVAAAAALVLAGCSTEDSKNVRTGGISPNMRVQVDADGVHVSVTLGSGGLNTVELGGDDSLTASAAGHQADLRGGTFLGVAGYGTTFDGVTRPGTKVTIGFRRGSDDTTAPDSSVTLPAAIQVLAPRARATLSRSRDVEVHVNDAPGSIRVSWRGSCVGTPVAPRDFVRGTPIVLPADTITHAAPSDGKAAPSSCLMILAVSRVLTGTLDPAYSGGQITAERPTSVLVRSVA